MSSEITYNATLTNVGLRESFAPGSKLIDQATKRRVSNTQAIGTTEEALILGEITVCRWAYFENKDVTNYLEIGTVPVATFVPFLRLGPGEYQIVQLATNAPFARANTLSCELNYCIFSS